MPTATYTPIASVTLSASASEVVFSGLPQTFRDLILVVVGSSTTSTGLLTEFNSDTNDANYSRVWMLGDGVNESSGSSNQRSFSDIFSYQSNSIIQIMDYSATDKHKTVLTRGNFTSDYVIAFAGRWASNNAINTIRVAPNGFSFNSSTTISLYGIAG